MLLIVRCLRYVGVHLSLLIGWLLVEFVVLVWLFGS